MGVLEGKVAFISGGARGQGRSHAVRLAQEGADIITFDICEQIATVAYPGASQADLDQTVKEVEALGQRIIARKADVREMDAVQAVLDEGVAEFGRVDIALANAGIGPFIGEHGKKLQAWHDAVDIMLTGVLYTCEAVIPAMVEQGEGGAIVITSSVAGLKSPTRVPALAIPGLLGYVAAKHGVVGLMRSYANALGPFNIRCNTVHPTGVNTPMLANEQFTQFASEQPTLMEAMHNTLPAPFIEAIDASNAIVYLCSDAGRYITGVAMPVDAGATTY